MDILLFEIASALKSTVDSKFLEFDHLKLDQVLSIVRFCLLALESQWSFKWFPVFVLFWRLVDYPEKPIRVVICLLVLLINSHIQEQNAKYLSYHRKHQTLQWISFKKTNSELISSGDMAVLVERSILLHFMSASENLESFDLCSLHCHLFLHLLPLLQVPPKQLSLSHYHYVLTCSKFMSAPTVQTYFYTKWRLAEQFMKPLGGLLIWSRRKGPTLQGQSSSIIILNWNLGVMPITLFIVCQAVQTW